MVIKRIDMEGRTVEEAIQKAAKQLKVKRADLRVKILSEETKGLFGMEGAKPAKIRAAAVKKRPREKQ